MAAIATHRSARSPVHVVGGRLARAEPLGDVVDEGDDLLGAGDERLDLAAAGVDDLLPRRQLDVGEVAARRCAR